MTSSTANSEPVSDRVREWALKLMYAQWVNPRPAGAQACVSDIQDYFSIDPQSWEELSPVSPYLSDLRLGYVKEEEWDRLAPEVEALLAGIMSNQELIEGAIQGASPNWRLDRMPIVDRLLLYIGCFELVVRGLVIDSERCGLGGDSARKARGQGDAESL